MELEQESILDRFLKLERECIGYDNYINCDDKHFSDTLENLRKLVVEIQRENVFSQNEPLKEVDTNNLKYFLTINNFLDS